MAWFTFILLLASFIPNLMQAYIVNAQSLDEVRETIIQTDHLNVSTIVRQVDEQLNWEVKYQVSISDANTVQRLKFKFFKARRAQMKISFLRWKFQVGATIKSVGLCHKN